MSPWVIVAGDVGNRGGQDKGDIALASFLADRGDTVHIVAHLVEPQLRRKTQKGVHKVPRPFGSHAVGQPLLDRVGRHVARTVPLRDPRTRVVVNDDNCSWSDINWVHSVHIAWPCHDRGAPLLARSKNHLEKAYDRARERLVVRTARIVIANARRTQRDLVDLLGVDEHQTDVQYIGSVPGAFGPVTPTERSAGRERSRIGNRPAVLLVGARGVARKKGFDILLKAWRTLGATPGWEGILVAVGSGHPGYWRRNVAAAGLDSSVRVLGAADNSPEVLATGDLMESPSRYESYGLNVQEALCRGVPRLLSASAGVTERSPPEMGDLPIPGSEDAKDLAARILCFQRERDRYRALDDRLGQELSALSWRDIARQMVRTIEQTGLA